MSKKEEIKKPELVAPAGSWSQLKSAVKAGCDAVYFGLKTLSMRQQAGNFDLLELKKVMNYLREHKKKGYLALNTIIYNSEVKKTEKILKEAKKQKVNAVICWDAAVLSIAKKLGLKIHISTQASISNFEALKFYQKLGAKRAVLARECSLDDIRTIIKRLKKNLDIEVEAFIHGAMCVSISGRCFLSEDVFKKSANRGECLQPCRREYRITDADNEAEYVIGQDYILSARDLCTIEFIDKLIEAGITSFKIEGRNRQPEYVKVVVACYREAIEAYFKGKLSDKLKKDLKKRLADVYHRGFSSGFYFKRPLSGGGLVERDYKKIYLGDVVKFYKKISVAEVVLRAGSLKKGDMVLVSGPRSQAEIFEVAELQKDKKYVARAKKGDKIGLKSPIGLRSGDKLYLWEKA